ncbi:amidohydrolase family protein [Candidatus Acetothermia bacterium]|nr:amidohydrolase family protein [Candidatus Acetothermia bacterium]MBI3660867.1 amidohydrolase family protein [Candidatus Acetothermia bacterium]
MRWTFIAKLSAALLLPGVLLAYSAGAGPSYTGPLFDVHLHQTSSLSLSDLIKVVQKAGLSRAVLLGPPATDTNVVLAAETQNPNFVFPFGYPTDPQTNRQVLNGDTVRLIEQQLDSKARRGIGEISLRHMSGPNVPGNNYPADGPVALQIYDLAASRKVPVTVHVEFEFSTELERGADHNRNAIIIWAHMGDGPPSLVRDILRKHPNLYVDISSRNPYFQRGRPIEDQTLTNSDGSLKSDWKSVFEEFADRVLFGIDLNNDRYLLLDQLIPYYRSVLGQLTPQTAEKIAYKNAQKLLGL